MNEIEIAQQRIKIEDINSQILDKKRMVTTLKDRIAWLERDMKELEEQKREIERRINKEKSFVDDSDNGDWIHDSDMGRRG